MDLTQRMRQNADDAAELEKLEPDQADLPSQIDAYLTDRLTAPQMDALCRSNQKDIDAEIERRDLAARRKKEKDERKAKSLWIDNLGTQADATAADAEIRKFILAHPHFPRHIPENANLLLGWLAENNLLCTLENLERGFKFLQPQGVFIQATEEDQAEARMSASEFKKMHASDWPEERAVPPLILQRLEKLLDTFCANHVEYIRSDANAQKLMAALPPGAVSLQSIEEAFQAVRGELQLGNASQRGEVLRYVDMGGHAPGWPSESEKYSFKMKIRSMTADQIAQRCLDDPQFKSALDNL